MAPIYSFDRTSFDFRIFEGCACVFGVFDGYHLGHRSIVEQAIADAKSCGRQCVVLTFDKDPDELFRPQTLVKLMSDQARLSTLSESGADAVVILPFTYELAALQPDDFLNLMFAQAAPGSLFVGEDFRFGAKAQGTVRDLQSSSVLLNTIVHPCALEMSGGQPITATRIRKLLAECRIAESNALLGRNYAMSGCVEPGRQQGREMGFATANVAIPRNEQALGAGVYAAYAQVDGVRFKAAVSMGKSPTFEEATAICEAHILDFDGDLYGQSLTLEFVEFLRPMKKFDDISDLIAAVEGNIRWCRENL